MSPRVLTIFTRLSKVLSVGPLTKSAAQAAPMIFPKVLVLTLASISLALSACTKPAERPRVSSWSDTHKKADSDAPVLEAQAEKREPEKKSATLNPPGATPAPLLGKKPAQPEIAPAEKVEMPDAKPMVSAPPVVSVPTSTLGSKEQVAAAKFENEIQKNYLSKFITGREFCEKFASVTSTENGRYIQVPVDYAHQARGRTELFAYFAEGAFDPKLPTLVMIDGGPGGNSHGIKRFSTKFNQLHFDQRGIGCSHPNSVDLYRDPSFYSSKNTAQDLEEIRKALKIEKLSVWGVSYGTLPATIYGSMFPSSTRTVVLEGTMYSGAEADVFKVISFNIKKMYAELPEATKNAMRAYFGTPEKRGGLYQLARLSMYNNGAFDSMKLLLGQIFPTPETINKEKADNIFDPKFFSRQFFEGERLATVEGATNKILQCREFPAKQMKFAIYQYAEALGIKLEFTPESVDYTNDPTCGALGVSPTEKVYVADQFPIKVPVTYFQGGWDGATAAAGAMQHYKKVPTGRKQLFVAVKGGHTPNIASLTMPPDSNIYAIQMQVFEKALRAEFATAAEVKAMNDAQPESYFPLDWKYTFKP